MLLAVCICKDVLIYKRAVLLFGILRPSMNDARVNYLETPQGEPLGYKLSSSSVGFIGYLILLQRNRCRICTYLVRLALISLRGGKYTGSTHNGSPLNVHTAVYR